MVEQKEKAGLETVAFLYSQSYQNAENSQERWYGIEELLDDAFNRILININKQN